MRTRVVTALWGNAWERYGRRFVETFARYWPAEVELVVYAGEPVPLLRGDCRELMAIPGLVEFLARHRHDAAATGHGPPTERWRAEHREAGYCWRYDACKWVRQAVVPFDAAQDLADGDLLCWLDADVVTHAAVPPGWIEGLLAGADLAYLGREGSHSEIGFLAFRLDAARPVLRSFAELYTTEAVFGLPETHSAFVFDAARGLWPQVAARNLTPGDRAHVWPRSPLAACTEHLKGKRKDLRKAKRAA